MKRNTINIACFVGAIITFLFPMLLKAQDQTAVRSKVRMGNELIEKDKKINEAADCYIEALKIDPDSKEARFNLGNARYEQGQYADAQVLYDAAAKVIDNKEQKAHAYHNLGNVMMQNKNYEGAVDQFKHSLLLNPKDDQTRYNLAYAQEKLKQQQEQKKKDKDKDKNKDKNKEKKQDQDQDKDKNKDKKDDKDKNKDQQKDQQNKDQQNKDQQKNKDQQNQQQQQQQSGMTKDEVNKMLEALTSNEQALQKKMAAKRAGSPVSSDKNW